MALHPLDRRRRGAARRDRRLALAKARRVRAFRERLLDEPRLEFVRYKGHPFHIFKDRMWFINTKALKFVPYRGGFRGGKRQAQGPPLLRP